jgi:hypothetical protein
MFFGADTLRIARLDEVARHLPTIDLALLPVSGLKIRPARNREGSLPGPGREGLDGPGVLA